MTEPPPKTTLTFLGFALTLLGLLMATLCGLCGSIFIIGGVWSALTSGTNDALQVAVMGAVVGGIPAALGVALFMLGRNMRR